MKRVYAPRWLEKDAAAIFRETARYLQANIPNYDACLDRTAVVVYAASAARLHRIREELQLPETSAQKRKRKVLTALASVYEGQVREMAEALGLTPASRLEILRSVNTAKGR